MSPSSINLVYIPSTSNRYLCGLDLFYTPYREKNGSGARERKTSIPCLMF